ARLAPDRRSGARQVRHRRRRRAGCGGRHRLRAAGHLRLGVGRQRGLPAHAGAHGAGAGGRAAERGARPPAALPAPDPDRDPALDREPRRDPRLARDPGAPPERAGGLRRGLRGGMVRAARARLRPDRARRVDLPALRRRPRPRVTPPMAEKARIPPGQGVTKGWPVLHVGPVPELDTAAWTLRVHGAVERPFTLAWRELQALERWSP